MRFSSAVAIAVYIGASGAAYADQSAELPVASTYNWTGAYLGGQVGHALGSKVSLDYEGGDSIFDYRLRPDGLFGGLYLGYNHQFDGGFILGAEGDLNWGNIRASGQTVGSPTYTSTTKLDWTGSARVRMGYELDRFLPYLTGGLAVAHFRFDEKQSGDFYSSAKGKLSGWTVGAGGEYALTDNWILRGEYRYTRYGTKDFVSNPVDENWTARIRTHDFRIGASYKF